ncbi:glutathione hydrolase 1 proenzyme-like [Hemitrygon akajei]|uniref:glutathione hydrolase 1 proenzyme-like n=1 Tax=Hemitrygon akajei TaxID=2704970 RepID=UPI003BF9FB67
MKRGKIGIAVAGALLLILVLSLGLHFGLRTKKHSYRRAAVATEAAKCSEIGRDILFLKNGSAVDAAIASMLCDGLHNAQSMGIGGGFYMIIYDAQTGAVDVIDSREVAPGSASQDMFVNDTDGLSEEGGLAIAIPAEIRGYQLAHQRHGKLKWKELFEPSIKLAQDGFPIGRALAAALKESKETIEKDQSLREVFCKKDGTILQKGDIIRFPKLAATYQVLADEGADAFYNGSLSEQIVADIRNAGGIITLDDLKSYTPRLMKNAVRLELGDYTLLTPNVPAGGPVLALILNILKGYNFSSDSVSTSAQKALTYHRITEAFKFGFAQRSKLGDPRFINITGVISNMTSDYFAAGLWAKITDNTTHGIKYYNPEYCTSESHGTAHISLVAEDGSAVSVTSSINLPFGSKVRSNTSGIIFNSQMDDFSNPDHKNQYEVQPSVPNFIEPGKTPMSSMCPAIILKDNSVKMVVGAAGGTRITTATALVIMNVLWFGYDAEEAVKMPRFHNQLDPNVTVFEEELKQEVRTGLEDRHQTLNVTDEPKKKSVVQAIVRNGEWWDAVSDHRNGGEPAGY